MLKETNFKPVYATGEDEPCEFYLDALMNSNEFDLALGYFSSSGFRALAIGFAFFIKRGGKMRIIINNVLSEEDKLAITEGMSAAPGKLVEDYIVNDIIRLKETLSKKDIHFFKCISWLISTKKLEIKASIPKKNKIGIVHQKFGLFKDNSTDILAFTGSVNFSANAFINNVEDLWCDFSWVNHPLSNERIQKFADIFHKTWSGTSDVSEIISIENVETTLRDNFPVENLRELLDEELSLIKEEISNDIPASYLKKIDNLLDNLQKALLDTNNSDFPQLRAYQEEALKNWARNGYKGLFEMATGTGKTITALSGARHLMEKEGHISLLILVPTLDLATQWETETQKYLLKRIILANSKNKDWYKETTAVINHKSDKYSYCIIATYATFLTKRFQNILDKFPFTTLLIADEVHNFGTESHTIKYPMHIQRRLGLSATPSRYFDDKGTKDILTYFNSENGPTFQFGMAEAIKNNFLCEYYYYPIIVTLTETELSEYKAISKRLLQYFNTKTGQFKDDSVVTMLLLRRKKIIHNASEKFSAFRQVLTEITKNVDEVKYLLVYVPEGDDKKIDKEDQKLINAYSEIIAKEFKLTQYQFIGLTKNRKKILDEFSKGKIAVLTAMKCLDEGIDIKRAETAIFCSSTGNPRQFIQRRGRILRTHPDKKYATIYDLVVVPLLTNQYFEDSLQMERNILQGELRRVHEFAELALNHYQALQTIEETAREFDLDIYSKT